jgi:hypothetical protein
MTQQLFLVAAVLTAAGCSHPLSVVVVDAVDHVPVVGAQVSRHDLKRPYFIVGAYVSKEDRVTDRSGMARLDKRGGILHVSANGYKHTLAAIERKADSMTVELEREQAGGR